MVGKTEWSRIDQRDATCRIGRDEYDRTIEEVTAAYQKILESSQTLLHVLKRETKSLNKKEKAASTPSKKEEL